MTADGTTPPEHEANAEPTGPIDLLSALQRSVERARATNSRAAGRPMSDATPRLGWPWCGDVPSGREVRGEVIATQHDDGRVALNWNREDATCTLVSRAVLEAVVDERNRLTADVEDLRDALDAHEANTVRGRAEVERLRNERER